jgi:hypothetical protein
MEIYITPGSPRAYQAQHQQNNQQRPAQAELEAPQSGSSNIEVDPTMYQLENRGRFLVLQANQYGELVPAYNPQDNSSTDNQHNASAYTIDQDRFGNLIYLRREEQ